MKTARIAFRLLIALGISQAAIMALAQQPAASAPPPDPTADPLLLSAGFLTAHPDLRYRLLGLGEMKEGKFEDAFRFFQRAAFYADKPSQGMVAEMLWNGQGVDRNPSLAYAWMDLAAERGYAGFLGLRERYWKALTEDQRAQALVQGQEVYAKYSDAAAQPRLAIVLRREQRRMTGSRTGFAGNVQIYIPGPGGFEQIDGTKFYEERYWDPKQYQAWHDSIWMKPRVGRVSIGEMEQIPDGEKPSSRVPATMPQTDAPEPTTPVRNEKGLGTSEDD